MEGWIKLHRKLLKHWIWNNDKYLKAWVYCLFRANHTENKVLIGSTLIALKKGEFITSRGNFAKNTDMSEQGVRTFWNLLETDKMITKESTSNSTKITICNYDTYQYQQPTNNKPITNKQPAANQPLTTDNNLKKEKQLKEFKEEVHTFDENYSLEMCEEFISYWTEPNKSKTKFRFQLQQTWDTSRRLATWAKRQYDKSESKNLYKGYEDSSFD